MTGRNSRGLFVGLATLDVLYESSGAWAPDRKRVAVRQLITAGGPAANAARTFSALGGDATLIAPLGQHVLAEAIRADLRAAGVTVIDCSSSPNVAPPISSIVVDTLTGERSVISVNATGHRVRNIDTEALDYSSLLIDGHLPGPSLAAASAARAHGVPVTFDGGSWKQDTATLLPAVDYAICAASFRPPDLSGDETVLEFLIRAGARAAAITNGPKPIRYSEGHISGTVSVPVVKAVDTTGAGDVFHGAFCFYLALERLPFRSALERAADVASRACTTLGLLKP